MPTLKDLKDKRNKLVTDAQALVIKEQVTAEDRESCKRMLADVDAIEADIKLMETIESKSADLRSTTSIPRPIPGAGVEGTPEVRTKEERQAFKNYIRTGAVDTRHMSLAGVETRDSGITSGSTSGGYLIPQSFYPVLVDAKKAWGGIINIVNEKKTADGAPMKVALSNDTGKQVSLINEITTVSESDPVLNGFISSTDLLTTGVITISLPELQDSAFDIDAFIRDNFGKRYFRGLSSLVTNGSSSGNIQSLLTAQTNYVTSAAADTGDTGGDTGGDSGDSGGDSGGDGGGGGGDGGG
jgi:HK97 family phage major capsid protein